jgi:hypothetical protein
MSRAPTGRRGQALALAMAITAAAVLWFGIVAPVQAWYQDRAELLHRQNAIAHRMGMLVETLPALKRQVEQAVQYRVASAGLLSGTTDALAATSLQQRIDEFAATSGTRVVSEEILPVLAEGGLRAISVRLTVTAPWRSLIRLFLALSRSEIPMAADEIIVRGPPGNTRDVDLTVDANLTVTSYRQAKVETE